MESARTMVLSSTSRRRTTSSASAYQERLLALYDEQPDFVLPSFRYNEARSFISGGGLQDFSISRAGEPLGHSTAVGREPGRLRLGRRVVNYLSALRYARPGEDLVPVFWPSGSALMAKDILRFHCVYWPAMLLAAGYDVPQQIFVHGWLLMNDRKISKSVGTSSIPCPSSRSTERSRALLSDRSATFGRDGAASEATLHERYERELGNELGNLVSRTTAMVARYRDGELWSGRVPGDRRPTRRAAR